MSEKKALGNAKCFLCIGSEGCGVWLVSAFHRGAHYQIGNRHMIRLMIYHDDYGWTLRYAATPV